MNASRGNEWEVVSLTASTYAAAPGPKEVEVKDDGKNSGYGDEAETSRTLFMSGHFVFPPNQHENLPLDTDKNEIVDEYEGKAVFSEVTVQKGIQSGGKEDDNLTLKGLNESEEFPGLPFLDQNYNRLASSGKEFEETAALQESIMSDKEQSLYSTDTFSSFHSETGFGGKLGIPETNEPSEQRLAFPTDSHSSEAAKDGNLPVEAWWKRRAASLYSHAKEASAFWSIFIAAAVMGIVILGQHWQQERWQILQLKWQNTINREKSGWMMGPISRLKGVIVGGHRRGSFIRGSSSSEN